MISNYTHKLSITFLNWLAFLYNNARKKMCQVQLTAIRFSFIQHFGSNCWIKLLNKTVEWNCWMNGLSLHMENCELNCETTSTNDSQNNLNWFACRHGELLGGSRPNSHLAWNWYAFGDVNPLISSPDYVLYGLILVITDLYSDCME